MIWSNFIDESGSKPNIHYNALQTFEFWEHAAPVEKKRFSFYFIQRIWWIDMKSVLQTKFAVFSEFCLQIKAKQPHFDAE